MDFDVKQREDELHDFYYLHLERLISDIPMVVFRERLDVLVEEMYKGLLMQK
jgi:hypothetical protein